MMFALWVLYQLKYNLRYIVLRVFVHNFVLFSCNILYMLSYNLVINTEYLM